MVVIGSSISGIKSTFKVITAQIEAKVIAPAKRKVSHLCFIAILVSKLMSITLSLLDN